MTPTAFPFRHAIVTIAAESTREVHREAIDEYKEAAKDSKDTDIRTFAVLATVTLYVSIYNLFTSLLHLLGFSAGDD